MKNVNPMKLSSEEDITATNNFIKKYYNGADQTWASAPLYRLPPKSFGKIAGYDQRYEGYWFSVD